MRLSGFIFRVTLLKEVASPFHLIRDLRNLLVLGQVILHKLIDPAVQFLALLFKIFKLFIKGSVPGRFQLIQALLQIGVLSLKTLQLHLLQTDLVLCLRAVALLVLLQFLKLLMQELDLGVFIPELLTIPRLLFLLECGHAPLRPLLLLGDPQLNLVLLEFVELL